MAQAAATGADVISLPSGGGDVAGLGETFRPDLQTGTGKYAIPIACPPGPGGLAPDLVLGYSTGGGNGPFGLGFNLAVMSISRRTSDGLPDYGSNPAAPPDTFQFSDSEPLIDAGNGRFRLEREHAFWLIERKADHWTVRTKDGATYTLGTSAASRIADPADPDRRVFAWLVDSLSDPHGNQMHYDYLADGAQRYLHSVRYGPFEVRIDYEDDRPDAFVARRAGFPIETGKRASRIRVLSNRDGARELRRYELEYELAAHRQLSLLRRVTLCAGTGAAYAAMPPVSFEYSGLDFADQELLRFTSAGVPPPALEGNVSLVDLTGDGLPDIVQADENNATYWRNLGGGRWAAPRPLSELPTAALGDPKLRFADLEGNGTADLLMGGDLPGYIPNAAGGDWENPVLYPTALPFDVADPNLRLIDIDGDGRFDAIYADVDAFIVFFNRGRAGWSQDVLRIPRIHDLELWPDVYFSDPGVGFADMTGDGLLDIVLVQSGDITFWPNLGYGRWGARQRMANAPVFPAGFDAQRMHLADFDGDGVADFIYVDEDTVSIWINQDGRQFAPAQVIDWLPPLGGATTVIIDALAAGRPGLLISWPGAVDTDYRLLRFGGRNAPYLMHAMDNGLGARTEIAYAPVERYRGPDREAGREWRSFLPFPMQVVSSVSVHDRWRNQATETTYTYREGHYDGERREFRGFALVDEVEAGDRWTPGARRRLTFDVGADLTLTEAERRLLPAALKAERRALTGAQLHASMFSLDPATGAEQELERIEAEWKVDRVAGTAETGSWHSHLVSTRTTSFAAAGPHLLNLERVIRDVDGDIAQRILEGGRLEANGLVATHFLRETMAYARGAEMAPGYTPKVLCERRLIDEAGTTLSLSRSYFDGPAFVGLGLGQMTAGKVSRIEELVFFGDASFAAFPSLDPTTLGYRRELLDGAVTWWRDQRRQEHDARGAVIAVMGPMGETTRIGRDAFGIHPLTVTNALGHRTTAAIDASVETISVLDQPSGHRERRIYDPLGRVVAQARLDDAGDELVYQIYRYRNATSDVPAAIETIAPRSRVSVEAFRAASGTQAIAAFPDAFIQVVYYDGAGGELQRRVSSEPGPDGLPRVAVGASILLDRRGFHRAACRPYFSTGFDYEPPASPPEPQQQFLRDPRGRIVETINSDGSKRKTSYSPWGSRGWDELVTGEAVGVVRIESLDAWGRLIEVEERASDGSLSTRGHYELDLKGNLKSIRDENGALTLELQHDALGRRRAINQVDSGQRHFVLNAGDKIAFALDPTAVRLRFERDILNRETAAFRLADPTDEPIRSFTYDADAGRPFLVGRLARGNAGDRAFEFAYDRGGLVTRKRQILASGRVLEMRTDHDLFSNVSRQIFPNGVEVAFTYNQANLISSVSGVIDGVEYSIDGLIQTRSYTNGISERFDYDDALRLRRSRVLDRGGAELHSLQYVHDGRGQLLGTEENLPGQASITSFGYDGLDRLGWIERDGIRRTFEHDGRGNLIRNEELGPGQLLYDDAAHPNRLTSSPHPSGSLTLDYDAAGRTVARSDYPEIAYDALGRMTHLARRDGAELDVEYGLGRDRTRSVWTEAAGYSETLHFDEVYEETAGRGTVHVMVGGTHVASLSDSGRPLPDLRVHHSDHLGSTRLVSNGQGLVEDRQRYGAYGMPTLPPGAATSYIGRDYDAGSGLYFLGERFFDPVVGRFLTPDPELIDNPAAFVYAPRAQNPYAYAAGNPIRFRDPNGRFFWVAFAVGFLIGAYLGYKAAEEQGRDPWGGALIGGIVGGLIGGLGGFPALLAGGKGALFSGGMALLTDRENFWTAAAIGFAFGGIGHFAGKWTPISGSGQWVDAQNFAIEVGIDAGLGALQGATFAAVTDQDVFSGFVDGAFKGALMSMAKIALFGVRYDPMSGADGSQNLRPEIDAKYRADTLNDNSHLRTKIGNSVPNLDNVAFRRHGLIPSMLGDRSIVLWDNANMAEGQEYNTSVLAHEIRHIHQQQLMTLGSVEFYSRYLFQAAFSPAWEHRYEASPLNTTYEVHHGF